jgi:hypothetical protein
MTITECLAELLSNILRLAGEKRRQLKGRKKHEGEEPRRMRRTASVHEEPGSFHFIASADHPMSCLLYTWQDTASLSR